MPLVAEDADWDDLLHTDVVSYASGTSGSVELSPSPDIVRFDTMDAPSPPQWAFHEHSTRDRKINTLYDYRSDLDLCDTNPATFTWRMPDATPDRVVVTLSPKDTLLTCAQQPTYTGA
jgi:hypothetical protein